MDQHKEEEENNSQESTDQRKEEEVKDSEEFVDQRKGDEEEEDSAELTDQRKEEEEEESSEEAMAASSAFVHPCSLLQYIVWVCACCLGFRDSSSDPQPRAASDAPAPDNSSQVGEDEKPCFYMQETITRVWAARRRPRPPPPGNPAEGNGGNGGHHN